MFNDAISSMDRSEANGPTGHEKATAHLVNAFTQLLEIIKQKDDAFIESQRQRIYEPSKGDMYAPRY